MKELHITQPDDWHIHLRDGNMLELTLEHAARQFGRVLAMPNLQPPITDIQAVKKYQKRIACYKKKPEVYFTLYLTDNSRIEDIAAATEDASILAVKWYPAGATTNSAQGVTDIEHCTDVLAYMENHGLVLSIHGEVVDSDVDIFHREQLFIERTLQPLRQRFPGLRIVLEHISSAAAANYVSTANDTNLAATITAHHLLVQRNDLLVGGIKPHLYCLPIVKKESDRIALLKAATSGMPCFFLGTDSAPHTTDTKEAACGCAGCYTGDFALSLYAEAFEQANALDKLEGFASTHGTNFYKVPAAQKTIRLVRKEMTIPQSYPSAKHTITPLFAGDTLNWRIAI